MTEHLNKAWAHRYKMLAAIVPLIVVIFIILGLYSGNACAIKVDGKVIAYAPTEKTAQNTIEKLIDEKSQLVGQQVAIAQKIDFETEKIMGEPLEGEKLQKQLEQKLDYVTDGAVVKVDGVVQFRFLNKDIAEDFINQLKNKHRTGFDYQTSFKEKVDIAVDKVSINQLDSVEDSLKIAEMGRGNAHTHIIEENDTLWDLALAYNTDVETIESLNAGITDSLQLGQEIIISDSRPVLTVQASYKISEERVIPYQTQYINDSSLAMGKREVAEEGKEGIREVIYQVSAVNGRIIEKTEIDEKIIEEPKPMVVKIGTQLIPSSRGGGLTWPTPGRVSSPFGSRWGRMHNGIDISGSHGNPVYAVGPGHVSSACWNGGYGNTIIISHGNNVQTLYAHLSSINVQVGQTVNQGQLIGRVGSTGNSTGPHLHFEIIINGASRNPMQYL